jgi:hypothetical protein
MELLFVQKMGIGGYIILLLLFAVPFVIYYRSLMSERLGIDKLDESAKELANDNLQIAADNLSKSNSLKKITFLIIVAPMIIGILFMLGSS